MKFIKLLVTLFFLPSRLVIGKLGITPEESGFFSAIINMMFWGAITYSILLPILVF